MARHRSVISQTRGSLYKLARVLGDVRAVEKGPGAIVTRIARRGAGRFTGRLLSRLFRGK